MEAWCLIHAPPLPAYALLKPLFKKAVYRLQGRSLPAVISHLLQEVTSAAKENAEKRFCKIADGRSNKDGPQTLPEIIKAANLFKCVLFFCVSMSDNGVLECLVI